MGLQRLEIGGVEGLDRGVLDRPVHALGLTIRPRMIGLGQTVLDPVLVTDPVEDVAAKSASMAEWRPRFLGKSAKAMPLSVRTVWIWYGKTSTTWRRKAAPLDLLLASKKATWTNLET